MNVIFGPAEHLWLGVYCHYSTEPKWFSILGPFYGLLHPDCGEQPYTECEIKMKPSISKSETEGEYYRHPALYPL